MGKTGENGGVEARVQVGLGGEKSRVKRKRQGGNPDV